MIEYASWRCIHDMAWYCPAEGCPMTRGMKPWCARDHGWKPGQPTPEECLPISDPEAMSAVVQRLSEWAAAGGRGSGDTRRLLDAWYQSERSLIDARASKRRAFEQLDDYVERTNMMLGERASIIAQLRAEAERLQELLIAAQKVGRAANKWASDVGYCFECERPNDEPHQEDCVLHAYHVVLGPPPDESPAPAAPEGATE